MLELSLRARDREDEHRRELAIKELDNKESGEQCKHDLAMKLIKGAIIMACMCFISFIGCVILRLLGHIGEENFTSIAIVLVSDLVGFGGVAGLGGFLKFLFSKN